MKLATADLHDACLTLGETPSSTTSTLAYFKTLYEAAGSARKAFQPQCLRSHAKSTIKETLKCLKRGGAKLSLQGSKKDLAERLANVLQTVMEQRCTV